MVGVDDVVEGVLGGTAWGVGFSVIAAAAVVGSPYVKPLAKQAIKGYLTVSEGARKGYADATQRAREWTAESTERLQDLYAEAKYEHETGLSAESSADDGATTDITATPAPAPRRRGQTAAATA
jgi:hypothetical protein